MRMEARFFINEEISLPYDLNYLISSYLLRCIKQADPGLADWLHNEGIAFQRRSYKPLVFSRPRFECRNNLRACMKVKGMLTFKADSIYPEIIRRLVEGIRSLGNLQLADAKIPLVDVQLEEPKRFSETMSYIALSPIVVPIQREKKLHYCHPLESPFYDGLRRSIRNWYAIRWGEELPQEVNIHISLIDPAAFNLNKAAVLVKYKDKNIKGYQIPLTIDAPPKVQEVIYQSGLGSYGSQGFGMVEIIHKKQG
ncbi:CRISPR-associated endoribonuclease Cas6 [Lihuaxuella thermophila]|uniref:CRISPR-associated endoribonuclease n=1 Tax=Lihuaxuella thermophila TaxID=1173111 RepID=A0A1H8IKL4_9BACL|nr:CRISPR-associated endoribonuclease Cas6 [Lihuaxuella thermophila]SEN68892.1 CRISPR-associated endoribonuclease Cas6 [Lihuaxuella thermophila]